MVTVLLGVWSFPAVSAARPAPAADAQAAPRAPAEGSRTALPTSEEASSFAAREQKSPDLANFKGGGVSIYIGSGAALVLLIILLIILL